MSNSRTVYSTETGKLCPECGKAVSGCVCKLDQQSSFSDGVVRLARETKGRKGKGVTLVKGLPQAGDELKTYAKKLKQVCGTGGTVKQGVIEIQGDHRDKLFEILQKEGYQVKKAGA